jgi:hypothetical protein
MVDTARRARTGSTPPDTHKPEFPLLWTGSLVDEKFWVVRDTLMETLTQTGSTVTGQWEIPHGHFSGNKIDVTQNRTVFVFFPLVCIFKS